MRRHGYRSDLAPALWLALLSALSGAVMGALLVWSVREFVSDPPDTSAEANRCWSVAARLDSELYVARARECPFLGTEPAVRRASR